MKSIEIELIKEKEILEKKLLKVRKRIENAPEGKMYVNKKKTYAEYYLKNSSYQGREMVKDKEEEDIKILNRKNVKYIRKENLSIAKEIAQRDYDISLLKNAEERIHAIEVFLRKYVKTDVSKIYEKTNEYRRILLEDVILSDEEYVRRWESVEYKGKSFLDEAVEIYTDRGERVRSKSEKIIADRLHVLGIPYRYEYPLQLKDGVTIYPDFTLLNIDTRAEVYLEHCGLMDDMNYVENLMYKLKTYEKNGIYLGVHLFITYESSRFPFHGKLLDELVKHLFSCTKQVSLVK